MAVGDIYRFQIQGNVQNRKVSNNWGYVQLSGADSLLIPEFINDSFQTDVLTEYLAMLSGDYQAQCMYTTSVEKGLAVPSEVDLLGAVGTRPGVAYPNDTPFTVPLLTDSNSSKDNGLLYITGFSEDDTTVGQLDPAFIATQGLAFTDALEAPLVATSGQTFNAVVIDGIFNGIPLVPKLFNTIVGAVVNGILRSQKRRRTKETKVAT